MLHFDRVRLLGSKGLDSTPLLGTNPPILIVNASTPALKTTLLVVEQTTLPIIARCVAQAGISLSTTRGTLGHGRTADLIEADIKAGWCQITRRAVREIQSRAAPPLVWWR
jgi:hypothetical protein